MKQNIDYKDFESLSEVAQKKARELWIPKIGDKAFIYPDNAMIGDIPDVGYINDIDNDMWINITEEDESGEYGGSSEFVRPLFSIGQMIEILNLGGTSSFYFEHRHHGEIAGEKVKYYWSFFESFNQIDGEGRIIEEKEYEKKELIDALWEAVKQLLEKTY